MFQTRCLLCLMFTPILERRIDTCSWEDRVCDIKMSPICVFIEITGQPRTEIRAIITGVV